MNVNHSFYYRFHQYHKLCLKILSQAGNWVEATKIIKEQVTSTGLPHRLKERLNKILVLL